ncbi:MAG TPA: aldo/keto reductase [Candidatus Sulfotelmatobacter sp.]|nr:aldo/keto reductase [Candidatus Sulfotelmatobacter sp.]
MKRREFFKVAAICGAASTLPATAQTKPAGSQENNSMQQIPLTSSAGTRKGDMLYRKLGRTGEEVSAIGMGGFHLGQHGLTEDVSIRLIRSAIDRGITFMDNSWDYNEGQSEIRMGKALKDGYRQKVFLMTKIDGRTKEVAARQIETSLERLQTDHIDLVQHHEVIRFDDPDRIFADGGAMEATIAARKAGKIRYIGFTGHKDPHIHLYTLKVAAEHGFHFDTVQMPLNVMDAHFRSFAQMVLPELVKDEIGVLGMKSMGDGVILKSKTVSPIECLHYALSLPTSVVITGIDKPEILDQGIEAVKTFQPMNREQIAQLLAKTKEVAMAGKYELFKTSSHFDSTAKHPDWLGGDTPSVQSLAPASS